MGREIERKFLVRDGTWRTEVHRSMRLRQAYLGDGGRASVRVRIADDHATINIKSAELTVTRDEYEYGIPLRDAEGLLALCSGCAVLKTRHLIARGRHIWEIDEFDGENTGLVVAEIELDDAAEEFARPAWLGSEVSCDARYYNVALARHPYAQWPR